MKTIKNNKIQILELSDMKNSLCGDINRLEMEKRNEAVDLTPDKNKPCNLKMR